MVKRVFDILLSVAGIFFFLPVFMLICYLIYFSEGAPIFFLQDRVGKGGRIFKLIKFRSMKTSRFAHIDVDLLKNDSRVTKVGAFLRSTAMDELPQLINILKGEMSFVGPKPLPYVIEDREKEQFSYLDQVPGYVQRIKVLPGLTGLAQIYAPKNSNRRQKFIYDLEYVNKHGIFLDIRLILLSILITFRGKWESGGQKI